MPRVVNHDERRATILGATCALIADEGLDAATMRRIAERAGSTTGLVTHYFDSKDEVLVAALRRVHRSAGQRMLDALALDPPDPLRAVVDEALPLDAGRRAEWRIWLAFWGRAASTPRLVDEQRRRYRQWHELLAGLVVDAGQPCATDDLIAIVDGVGTRATLDPRAFPASAQRAAIDRFLRPGGRAAGGSGP